MKRPVAVSLMLITALSLALGGCKQKESAETDPILTKAMTYPLGFSVSNENIEAVWAKARLAITEFGSMKLQVDGSHLLQTHIPTEVGQVGLQVIRLPIPEGFSVTVNGLCYPGNIHAIIDEKRKADQVAHLLAYYLQKDLPAKERPTPEELAQRTVAYALELAQTSNEAAIAALEAWIIAHKDKGPEYKAAIDKVQACLDSLREKGTAQPAQEISR